MIKTNVTLMVDEVYTAQIIEHSNGAFTGLTEEGLFVPRIRKFALKNSFPMCE